MLLSYVKRLGFCTALYKYYYHYHCTDFHKELPGTQYVTKKSNNSHDVSLVDDGSGTQVLSVGSSLSLEVDDNSLSTYTIGANRGGLGGRAIDKKQKHVPD